MKNSKSNCPFCEMSKSKWENKGLKINKKYWYINSEGIVEEQYWSNCATEQDRFKFGNVFLSKKEAKKMAEKIRKIFKYQI